MGSPYKRSTKLLGYSPLHIIWMFSLLWFCKLCISVVCDEINWLIDWPQALNQNLHVSELSQLIVQILDTLHFWGSFGRLRDNVRCSSWAHWKARSGLSINWTFFARCYGWGATGENKSKIGFLKAGGSVCAKFSRRRGRPPPIIFARLVRPMNALQLCRWQFHTKKLCSRLSSSEVRFYTENGRYGKRSFCVFEGQRTMIILGSLESARCRLPIGVNWTF